jgi:hypothetical protein
MKKMSFLLYGYRTIRQKTLSDDVVDTGPWPADPAGSSPSPTHSASSSSLLSLSSSGRMRKGENKTDKEEENEERKRMSLGHLSACFM